MYYYVMHVRNAIYKPLVSATDNQTQWCLTSLLRIYWTLRSFVKQASQWATCTFSPWKKNTMSISPRGAMSAPALATFPSMRHRQVQVGIYVAYSCTHLHLWTWILEKLPHLVIQLRFILSIQNQMHLTDCVVCNWKCLSHALPILDCTPSLKKINCILFDFEF